MRFSKLDSRPVDASVYASPGTSRRPAQDSRSRWFATPFLWGSFIPCCTPVYPDDCAPLQSRLSKGCGRVRTCTVDPFVEYRQLEQRQDGGAEQASDHHGC